MQTNSNVGEVVSVRGSVVDIRFCGSLPPIYTVLRAGEGRKVVIEVLAQLDERLVRGIALTPTQGLARGMMVEDTGGPLKAPVGKGILSRMFDVFGNAIDREPPPADVQWRTVHRAPPALARRSTKSEVFETGIKAIDVLMPLERGGKAGLFGGAGVGKTVLLTELIHNMIGHQEGINTHEDPALDCGRPHGRLPGFVRAYLFVSLFRACAYSLASENESRLAAMQRAEKNIEDLLEDLNRTRHRVRQSGIDEELFDVVSGFEAMGAGSVTGR